tara:strand:- start:3194 stop:4639 length:1446 start_codon:yes stop_codon:yes gene_type:complete
MSKVPIQNQGFRIDLNLQESNDDDAAWDNLYNPGISKDLSILVNNLRNTSILGPGNTPPLVITLTTNETNDANYEVNNVNTKAPHFFTSNKSRKVTNSIILTSNDKSILTGIGTNYAVTTQATRGTATINAAGVWEYEPNNNEDGIVNKEDSFTVTIADNSENTLSKVITTYISEWELTDSTFTNDDTIQVNEEITFNIGDRSGNGSGTVGSLATETLIPNKDYYVCSSNARNAFKISTTPSGDAVGVSTIPIISVNSNNGSFTSTFGFIRKDGVTAPNLTAFIKPEILDENFSYLGDTGINGSFSNNVTAYEYSEFLIEKKYKTNKDILSDRDVKFEGSVRVKDPQGYNDGATALNATKDDNVTPDSPGIFIGDTRAFSTDNNPWQKSSTTPNTLYYNLFSTLSHSDEFTIGDLEFGGVTNDSGVVTAGQIKIKGLSAEIVDITASDSKLVNKLSGSNPNVYKFPMIINGETYYILVERE